MARAKALRPHARAKRICAASLSNGSMGSNRRWVVPSRRRGCWALSLRTPARSFAQANVLVALEIVPMITVVCRPASRRADKQVAFCYHGRMAQPVKLSDGLVLDARLTGEAAERSINGQIELWAQLGRAVERVLRTDQVLALKRRGSVVPLSALLDLKSEAQQAEFAAQFKAHLEAKPFPHFEPAAESGLLVRIDEDGTRTVGRFVNREFRAVVR